MTSFSQQVPGSHPLFRLNVFLDDTHSLQPRISTTPADIYCSSDAADRDEVSWGTTCLGSNSKIIIAWSSSAGAAAEESDTPRTILYILRRSSSATCGTYLQLLLSTKTLAEQYMDLSIFKKKNATKTCAMSELGNRLGRCSV